MSQMKTMFNPKDSRSAIDCPMCKGSGRAMGDFYVDRLEHFAWRLKTDWVLDNNCLHRWKELCGHNAFRQAQAYQVLHKIFKKEKESALLRDM